jgi:DNA-binding transcriptional ArsR family regulator
VSFLRGMTALPAGLPLAAEAKLFKALADAQRLAILRLIAIDGLAVGELTARLPLNQPTVSHHLRILREAGLVRAQRCKTSLRYELTPDAAARIDAALSVLFPDYFTSSVWAPTRGSG